MSDQIKKAAVIGSGVMGSGIAAHLANAGIPVLLLDLPQKEGNKNALAEGALERMKKMEPAPFMSEGAMRLVTPGNTETDLEKLGECDWVVEAIIENLDIKKELYAKLEKVIKSSTIVSSNTSTIPLAKLIEGRSAHFTKNFFITHFFNPPRYTRLLELVSGPQSDATSLKTLESFIDVKLGKGVVRCHDTPGFIANRIGTFWIQRAIAEAFDRDIQVEEADAIFGQPLGIPKTGVFGLVDLVGLDLMPLITKSMKQLLPATDRFVRNDKPIPVIDKLIQEGYTGRKGKGGFYRLVPGNGKKVKESVSLKTGEFSPSQKAKLAFLDQTKGNPQMLVSQDNPYSQYAWSVLSEVFCYCAELVDQIAGSIFALDTAMRLGYNWKFGPFELMDQIGVSWIVDKLRSEKKEVPALLDQVLSKGKKSFYQVQEGQITYFDSKTNSYVPIHRPEGVLLLSDIKLKSKPLAKNGSASLWDIGDGVVCLEFTSKMNSIDPDIMTMITQSIEIVQKGYKALVVYNEGTNFSAGANLGLALFSINVGMWPLIEETVANGQKAYQAMKYAPFPVVGAPSGIAVGGGCEVLLHCDAIEAHAETYVGLVEVGVGIVPAWGGCKEMLHRWLTNKKRPAGGMVAVGKVFETIGTAKVAKSAYEAKDLQFFRDTDGVVMNRDRVLWAAKQRALSMVDSYQAPKPIVLNLPGSGARISMMMAVKALVKTGKATEYDEVIAQKLAYILTGGEEEDVTEDDILKLERDAFLSLVKEPKTLARMEHILETGKPLRN